MKTFFFVLFDVILVYLTYLIWHNYGQEVGKIFICIVALFGCRNILRHLHKKESI